MDEIVDPTGSQAANTRIDTIERKTSRSGQLCRNELLAGRAAFVADTNARSANQVDPAEPRDVVRTNQGELSELHVGHREADSLAAFGRNGHAAHDDIDLAPFERANQLAERVAFEDDSATEGVAYEACKIRFDTDNFTVFFEDQWGVSERDAHPKRGSLRAAEGAAIASAGGPKRDQKHENDGSQTVRSEPGSARISLVGPAVVDLCHPYPRLLAQATALQLDAPISTLRRPVQQREGVGCPIPSRKQFCEARIECPII